MICKLCGEDKKYYAHGLCRACYVKQYMSKEVNKTHRNEMDRERRYKNGCKPMADNRSCSSFLGIHIAEQVLSKVFKNVETMPPNNPGFDFICNKGKKIDVKSSCTRVNKLGRREWGFKINKNTVADYFLCLIFDNRNDLNPLHVWLIPGKLFSKRMGVSLSESTLSKWDEYKIDIDKVTACCNHMRGTAGNH